MKPGGGKNVWNLRGEKIYRTESTQGAWVTSCVEHSRETGGREKRLKPTRGRKFIPSNPREARGLGAPRGRRVEKGLMYGSNTTVRRDRNRSGGGVAIYIRSHIPYIIQKDLMTDNLELICIEIKKTERQTTVNYNVV